MSDHVHGAPDNIYQDDDGFDLPHSDPEELNDLPLELDGWDPNQLLEGFGVIKI